MKLLLTIVAATATCIASAQNLPNVAIGAVQEGDKSGYVSEPSSTILVDITLSTTQFVAGTYARYAQKYLGERAPLTDKTSTEIIGSAILLAPQDYGICESTSIPDATVEVQVQPLPVDRNSSATLTPESAAQNAANEIFAIRKTTRDLVAGDIGEGVFGTGLTSALERLDKLESDYVALFMGKSIVTTKTQRFTINLKSNTTRYMVCRYDPQKGFLPATEIDGEPVYIQITPSETKDSTFGISRTKAASAGIYIVANPSQCDLYIGADIISTSTLPLYDFGSRVTLQIN